MAETDKLFAGSIPDIYDDLLVPLIFEAYATDISRRVVAYQPGNVLETAAGSGVVTRALAPLLSRNARYIVTDLNQPMLDRAKVRQPQDTRIAWQQADALALPFEDDGFDAVCCQFGVMFFPDKVQGYREARRVLKDGGQFVFNVWDSIEHNEFAECVTQTACGFFPDDPPLFLARTPHGYHDVDLIYKEVRAAGFKSVDIHTIAEESRAPSPREPAIAYCQGTPLRNEIEARDSSLLEWITEQAAHDIERRFGSGAISGKIQGYAIVATK